MAQQMLPKVNTIPTLPKIPYQIEDKYSMKNNHNYVLPSQGTKAQRMLPIDQTTPNLPDLFHLVGDKYILRPNCNDVLLGRGNYAKCWSGNQFFRYLVQNKKYEYVVAEPRQKRDIALHVIDIVSKLNPPGRFLEKNKQTNTWYEVEFKIALKKTRQALREDAPIIKQEIAPISETIQDGIKDEEISNFLALVSQIISIKVSYVRYLMNF